MVTNDVINIIRFDAFRKHLTGINQLGDDLPADLFKPIKEFPLTKMLARLREPGIEEWEMVSRIFMCSCRSWLGSTYLNIDTNQCCSKMEGIDLGNSCFVPASVLLHGGGAE